MSLNSHLFFMHIPSVSWIYYKQNQLAVREKNHIIKPFSTALFSPLSSKFEITLCLSVNLLLRVKCKQHPHSCLISNVHKMPSPWRLTCYDSTPKACDWPTAGGSAMCFCLNKPAGTHRGEWMREAPQTHTHLHTLCGQDSSVDITIVWGPWGRIRVRKSCLTDLLVHIVCENNGRHGRPIVWVKARQKALNHHPLY